MKKIIVINEIKDWEKYKQENYNGSETIVFKFSPVCSISRAVENIFDRWFTNLPEETNINCIKIDVINSRVVSNKIAGELDVMHQSPQVIWLSQNNKVKWSESHYSITESELDSNLKNQSVS